VFGNTYCQTLGRGQRAGQGTRGPAQPLPNQHGQGTASSPRVARHSRGVTQDVAWVQASTTRVDVASAHLQPRPTEPQGISSPSGNGQSTAMLRPRRSHATALGKAQSERLLAMAAAIPCMSFSAYFAYCLSLGLAAASTPSKNSTAPVSTEYSAPTTSRPSCWISCSRSSESRRR